MDTNQINTIALNNSILKRSYIGCFPLDRIPDLNNILDNNFLICNTLSSHDSVTKLGHGLLIYCFRDIIYFFDSFGFSPIHYGTYIIKKIDSIKNRKVSYVSDYPIQSNDSYACGPFCMYFAYKLCIGIEPDKILKRFSRNNRRGNDGIVVKFIFKLAAFPKNTCKPFLCPMLTFKEKCFQYCEC